MSLHKHWITADAVLERVRLDIPVPKGGAGVPVDFLAVAQTLSRIQTLAVFYGLLYVVVEGFLELKLVDDRIAELLKQEQYTDQLRRFRNSVFHYQKDPFDKRLIEFLDAKDSDIWGKALHRAFAEFFERTLNLKEVLAKVQKSEE